MAPMALMVQDQCEQSYDPLEPSTFDQKEWQISPKTPPKPSKLLMGNPMHTGIGIPC